MSKRINDSKGRESSEKGLVGKFKDWFMKSPKRNTALSALAATTLAVAPLDNVHFGNVRLNDMQGNHYVFGVFPSNKIHGESKGNIRTFGLISAENVLGEDSTLEGNMSSFGMFFAVNMGKDDSRVTGNLSSYGLFGSANKIFRNSNIVGNMSSYGLILHANDLDKGASIRGNMSGAAAVLGLGCYEDGARVEEGDFSSVGLIAGSPRGFHFLTYSEQGMKDFTVKNIKRDTLADGRE